ncbi:hypothetical protein Micbo1qcDRAFT_186054 [Microdochium bolleyi]|uniref:Nucleoside phosphorylase domain-containing protein n=1 Tax=Microdochium bolleyi TaxID=196109 RepID=A0A136INT2_9PEZI|nr:hypothetical protein Micbo1qcDRAFT_186054 [Microdochium bolleyi]
MASRNRPSAVASRPQRPATRRDFEIAIICALVHEADAVEALFDHHWEDDGTPYDKAPGDLNAYSIGSIGRHNVVLAHMPGMGKASAAAVAAHCKMSFPGIRLALIVGVCGAVPFYGDDRREIVLGDVIVSSGVVQYDLGRRFPERFTRKDTLLDSLGRPNTELRSVLSKMQGFRGRKMLQSKLVEYLAIIQGQPGLHARYPGKERDKLFDAGYRHITDGKLCDECGCSDDLIQRARHSDPDTSTVPEVHFGLIASGDTVLKSGYDREDIARQENAIGFEMEGVGVWDMFPCVVIKGACDYADSHKTKDWQHYAAATAAACMKAFLDSWGPVRIVSLPAMRNKNFTGRTAVLEEIKGRLFSDEDCQRLAIVGLGGIGKTQIALHFAHWVRDTHNDYSIFWLPVLSLQGFDQAYLEMGRRLGVETDPDEEDHKETIRAHMSSEEAGRWLLIIDNADDAELVLDSAGINDCLPESQAGRILFTTRSFDVGSAVAGFDVIELHGMNPREAKELMDKSLISKQGGPDDAATAALLRELTYLPLAITQAAAYMHRNRISAGRYLELLHATKQNMVELMSKEFRDNTRYRESRNAVATTWQVSFDQIKATNNTAAELLAFISCIEPKAIPRSLLQGRSSELESIEAIGTLLGYSFLIDRGDGEAYDMHSLSEKAFMDETDEGRLRTLFELAQTYCDHQREEEGIRLFEHVLEIERRILDEVDPSLLISEQRLAQAHRQNGQYQKAIELFEHVVEVEATFMGDRDPTYRENGQYQQAIELFEHVVEAEATFLDDHDLSRLLSQYELGIAYRESGQHQKAIELLEHVASIERTVLEAQDSSQLMTQHALAVSYLGAHRSQEAIDLLEVVVAVKTRTLDEKDTGGLFSQGRLAEAFLQVGRAQEATPILQHYVVHKERCPPDAKIRDTKRLLVLLWDVCSQLKTQERFGAEGTDRDGDSPEA